MTDYVLLVASRLGNLGLSSLRSASACFFEFAIAFLHDHLLETGQLVGGRDVVDGTVQAHVIVMLDKIMHP